MESGKHALQGTVVSNKIQPFLMVGFQWNMASGREQWQVAAGYGT